MKESELVKQSEFKKHLGEDPNQAHRIMDKVRTGVLPTLVVDTNTIKCDSVNHRVGVCNSAPAYTLDVTGNIRCSTGFGCNSKNPQTAYASGGALSAYVDGTHGLDTAAHMLDLYNLAKNTRAALVAMGILS